MHMQASIRLNAAARPRRSTEGEREREEREAGAKRGSRLRILRAIDHLGFGHRGARTRRPRPTVRMDGKDGGGGKEEGERMAVAREREGLWLKSVTISR